MITAFKALLNPWVLLALVAAFLGFGAWSYQMGDENGSQRVQRVLEAGQKAAADARVAKILANQKIEQELQAAANKEREATNEENKRLTVELDAAERRLRQRAARPPALASGELPKNAGPGAGVAWATGADLYSDDGIFLTREAHLAQRVRNQRDTCYRLYREAQTKIKGAGQ